MALNKLALQTESLLLFPYDPVRPIHSTPLKGRYSLWEALQILLQGTDLQGSLTKSGVITVTARVVEVGEEKESVKAKKHILSSVVSFLLGTSERKQFLARGGGQSKGESRRLIEELVVVGTAATDQNSTELKRHADNIMDVLAADEIGTLPDINIAEVFERIAGVSTTSANGDDEGQFILIRGMESNAASFDGIGMASGSNSRRTNLEAIPSSTVVRAEVNKSVSAKLEGQGLGGSVNMSSRSAFSTAGMFFKFDVERKQYSEDRAPISDVGSSPMYGLTYSNTFGLEEQFGFVFSTQADARDAEIIKYFMEYDFYKRGDGSVDAYTSQKPWAEDRTNKYDRKNALVKFEYKTDDYYAFLSGFYFDKDEEVLSNRWILKSRGLILDPLVTGEDYAGATQGQAEILDRNEAKQRENSRAHFHIDTVFNDEHAVSFDIAHGLARRGSQDIKWEFETSDDNENLGFQTYGRGNWAVDKPEYFQDGDNYDFAYYQENYTTYLNKVTEIKVDWEFSVEGEDSSWGFGAGPKFRNNHFERDTDKNEENSDAGLTLAQFDGGYGYTPDGFMGYVEPHSNRADFLDYYAANRDEFYSRYSEDEQSNENLRSDWIFDEDISTVYVQARYRSPKWSISGGVRVEHTSMESTGWTDDFIYVEGESTGVRTNVPTENTASYTNVLPSVNIAYHFTDDLMLRMAASKSIMRANPGDTHSGIEVDYYTDERESDIGSYTVQVKRKNKGLLPQESINSEISLEYYFPEGVFAEGMASVTAFKKDIIRAPITSKFLEESVAEYGGNSVLYEEKVSSSDRNIKGYEVNLKMRNFKFLHQSLQGLGLSSNVTWLSGSEKFTDYVGDFHEYDDLVNQPDRMSNVTLYYSFMGGRGEAKLAYKYKGYTRINRSDRAPYSSEFWAPKEHLDFQLTYNVTENVRAKLDVKNLRAEATNRMQGYHHELLRHNNQYGRATILGLSYTY